MKTDQAHTAALHLARCDATGTMLTAYCFTSLNSDAPEWVHLMPAGEIETRDSRKPWRLSDPASVIAGSRSAKMDLVIDFEHQTDNAANNGQPAPAAGWIVEMQARPDGIWGRVEWTDRARAMIEAGEYRFLSPTFLYDPKTREVDRILRAGLTNNPALFLTALAKEEEPMEELLRALAKALGLPEDSDRDAILAKLTTVTTSADTAVAQVSAFATAVGVAEDASAEDIAAALASRSDDEDDPDPAKYVSIEDYNKLSTALATLQSTVTGDKATEKVDAAIRAGKIIPAQRDWALDLAKNNPDGFDAFVKNQPIIVAPGDSHTGDVPGNGPVTLDAEDLAVCTAMGIAPDDYKKTREEERAQ